MGGKKCFINLYFQSTLQTCNLNTFVFENDFEYSPFLLTKLEHDSTIFPSLLLAYTFDVLDHIHQHNQPNTIRYLLCVIYYTLYTIHYVLYTIHYTLCIMHYVLYTIYYALYIMHYALRTIHYTLFTMHYALYTRHYTLCTMYYVLFTMHYTLYTIYYALYTIHYLLCIMYYPLCTMHYSYVFIRIYYFIHIHTYSLFHVEIQQNPVISVPTRSSRRVE